jgi:hypothetical protein
MLVLRERIISDFIVIFFAIFMCITFIADTVLTELIYFKDIPLFRRMNLYFKDISLFRRMNLYLKDISLCRRMNLYFKDISLFRRMNLTSSATSLRLLEKISGKS